MGKKTPLTLAHFGFDRDGSILDDNLLPNNLTAEWREDNANADKSFPSYARMLKHHGMEEGESRYSWTVDFTARRAKAREAMQPLLDEATQIKATVIDLKEKLKRLKKEQAGTAELETQIRDKEKAIRELENKAADLDAAVFDLKAVNPNAVAKIDSRTPQQIIQNIETQGRIISEALTKLNTLLN
ncbi:MAG: hypothetical protein H6937_01935 [Burkholderiales bacterium]|nr:hypothetical protein [Burkholderiales bacterium]